MTRPNRPQLRGLHEVPHGYHGRYLRIDLSRRRCEPRALPAEILRQYLGGSGLGVYLALLERAAPVDATSPAAGMAIVFSPLVGSPLTTSAKFAVVSKSPLTDRINDSLASSGLALAGKKTGFDAFWITGRASNPSLLVIDDGQVRIEDAADLWGMTCRATETRLQQRLGPGWQLAVIGPAGERQVRYATISHDGRHAGRGGSGAVLGSKNVKAIAVRGSTRTRWAQPEALSRLAKRLSARSFGPATAKYRELGTATNLLTFNRLRCLPTENFQRGSFEQAQQLAPERLAAVRAKTQASCVACTIGCEHIYALAPRPSGAEPQADGSLEPRSEQAVRLEYESLFALGSLCGIGDADTVLAAVKQCDELGIDTISAGGTIAFAMECAARGLLEAPWLRFGEPQALLRALDEIGHRRGLGDRLAEGSRRLGEQLGPDALAFAPHVKGLEIPGYEPRALQTMALGFAVGARGADHNRSGAYEADFAAGTNRRRPGRSAAEAAIETENRAAILDSLILCKFLRGALDDVFADAAEMLQLVTGWQTTAEQLRQTSRRIIAAKKLFNVRAGWTPAEDTLPPRFLREGLADDASAALDAGQFAEHIQMYNRARDWTGEGWLPAEQLRQLGLAEL